MDDRLTQIERTLRNIEDRNARVESDKAWEVSFVRRGLIALVTYVVALGVLLSIGSTQSFTNALIPTAGYLLSTLSLPAIKRWWIRNAR